MTDFDPVKAAREELAGLHETQRAVIRREQQEQAKLAEAETELTALRKINGFLRILIEQKRLALQRLQEAEGR
jgi:hypothetical protein